MQLGSLNLIHDWGIGARNSYCVVGCASQAEGEI